jgi:hypothetical protein
LYLCCWWSRNLLPVFSIKKNYKVREIGKKIGQLLPLQVLQVKHLWVFLLWFHSANDSIFGKRFFLSSGLWNYHQYLFNSVGIDNEAYFGYLASSL